jgi:hypothetical protein
LATLKPLESLEANLEVSAFTTPSISPSGGLKLFRTKRPQKTIFDPDVYLPPERLKALHNFRTLACINEMAREIFTHMTGKMIEAASLSAEKQRLNSTQITSNMAHLSRLGLFTRTIKGFLRSVEKHDASLYEDLPTVYRRVYRSAPGTLPMSNPPRPSGVLASAPGTCSRSWTVSELTPRSRSSRPTA